MRNPKLVPYETIVRATSGEPEAVDEVLRHYGKRIRLASLENGHVSKDTEDNIKRRLIAALFQFRFDEQPYKKLNNCRCIERNTVTGNQKKISCFFALIFVVLKNRQYYAVQRGIKKFPLLFANPQVVRGGRQGENLPCFVWQLSDFGGVENERKMKKFLQIPAYPGLCGVVRNEGRFSQINVHFAFCWFVGIGERFFPQLWQNLSVRH